MVDRVAAAGVQVSSLTAGLTGNQEMGRDAFLKLLVAQMKNQDPLKPQDNSQFVAELAQFSSLEQSMGINERLDALMTQNRGLANTEVANLVGKTATVKGTIVTSDGTGAGSPVNFTLAGASDSTVVTIKDQNGRVVRTMDLGQKPAGLAKVSWDGRDDTGLVQPAGAYTVSISAKTADGTTVAVTQETTGVIQSVSFDQGYPALKLSNGVTVPVSDLIRVGQ